MAIDVEPKDLGPVVQLVANPKGWRQKETRYWLNPLFITGNPDPSIDHHTQDNLIEPLKVAWLTTKEKRPTDFNGLKVAVRRLSVSDGILYTNGVKTDYNTVWGLPQADASKDLYAEHEKQVVVNRTTAPNAIYETRIPWALCSHNILIDPNGFILMMTRSWDVGFHTGKISATQERQMDPTIDFTPFAVSERSFREELNLTIPTRNIRLLGVALEKGAAYAAYCFVAETREYAKGIADKWRHAKGSKENTALLAVEMSDIDKWLNAPQLTPEIWHPSVLAGNIALDANLEFHPTSPWRIGLAQKYSKLEG